MDGESNPIMPRPIDYLVSSAIDNTSAHQNIDTLLLQSKLDEQIKNESLYGAIYADKSPEYKGGIDPVVENIAMSPIMTLKSLGSVGKKILEKTSLRNPLYHFTSLPESRDIMKSWTIRGGERAFPGKPFKEDISSKKIRKLYGEGAPPEKSPAVSVTRDPKFASRPHKHIGTDVRFIMDRDDLIKKGFKIEPFAQGSYRKTFDKLLSPEQYKKIHGYYPNQMNPMFEFEERVRGNIPTENIKLVDLLKFPTWNDWYGDVGFLHDILKRKIPIMMSKEARAGIKQVQERVPKYFPPKEFKKLMKAPTYTYNPFKSK